MDLTEFAFTLILISIPQSAALNFLVAQIIGIYKRELALKILSLALVEALLSCSLYVLHFPYPLRIFINFSFFAIASSYILSINWPIAIRYTIITYSIPIITESTLVLVASNFINISFENEVKNFPTFLPILHLSIVMYGIGAIWSIKSNYIFEKKGMVLEISKNYSKTIIY
ncbi:hypothetical protein, partial [Heliomicrobium undosum]|uniref:hypothetical protein n=1 Tax=Heliomicrobium undosum TaxID=121734 RepID=UPI001A9C0F03